MFNDGSQHSFYERFFSFDAFITVRFIRVIFIAGVAVAILTAMVSCVGLAFAAHYYFMNADQSGTAMGVITFLGGSLITFVATMLGLVFWRIFCELLVVVFKINENLQSLRDRP